MNTYKAWGMPIYNQSCPYGRINSFQNWISIPILAIFVLFFQIGIHVSILEDLIGFLK